MYTQMTPLARLLVFVLQMKNKELYSTYFAELRNEVAEKNLLAPSPLYGSINLLVCFSLYVAWLIFMEQMPIMATIVLFYVLIVELGFISHDLIHGQYFSSAKTNRFFSYVSANLLIGLSRSWWAKKHNVDHHSFTNSDIHDSDIRDYDEIFTKNKGKSPFFHAHKTVLFWFATTVLYINLIFLSYTYVFQNKKYGEFLLSIGFIGLLPLNLYIHFWFVTACLALVGIYVLVGVHLAFGFMVNHVGMEVIDGNTIREYSWLDLQTRTSRNIRWGAVINHLFWGLNKQVEHHLFPGASRQNIVAISQIVRRFCAEKNIPYHEVSFWKSMQEIYHTLKTGETVTF